jgi:hypothetical protein
MRRIVALSVLCSLSILVFGQNLSDKPDLSGTWRLVESKKIAQMSGQTDLFEKILVILHREPEIKITTQLKDNGSTKELETVFFADSRGETNSTFREGGKKTTTRWSGKKLEILRVDTMSVTDTAGLTKVIKVEHTERWELSKDGNTLTRTSQLSGPADVKFKNALGGGPSTEVFSRVK